MRRTRTRALTLAAAVLVAAVALTGCNAAQANESVQRINEARDAQGLPPLQVEDGLARKAQAWADRLAASGSLGHSSLTADVPGGWSYLAENVGSASSIAEMHALYMASPPHRANILDRRSNRVGVGVAEGGGRVYVVQEFGAY